jgi:hypothetical protein
MSPKGFFVSLDALKVPQEGIADRVGLVTQVGLIDTQERSKPLRRERQKRQPRRPPRRRLPEVQLRSDASGKRWLAFPMQVPPSY